MSMLNLPHPYFGDGYTFSPWLLALLAAICIFGRMKLQRSHDPQEPPLVRPRLPLIGHLIGLATRRMEYLHQLGLENLEQPIFTLPMGPDKLYVITSPQLIQVAMRNKSLSFHPMMAQFAQRLVGFGPRVMKLFHHPPTDGSIKWLDDQHKSFVALYPGPSLQKMNRYVLNSISGIINDIGNDFETKTIYLWLRDCFTMATVGSLFGEHSSLMDDPTLSKNLWDYDGGQMQLLLQPFPSITARKAYQGRAKVQQALRKYFREGGDQNSDVSGIIKNRVATNRKWGLGNDDLADHEFGMLFVSVTNAIPTLFWMIFYVFRDSQLVLDLQKELLKIVESRGENEAGQREYIFDITKLSVKSPLLVATYQEVMRLTNRQLGTRTVLEDTTITYTPVTEGSSAPRTYVLKKGVNIQMPAIITNFATATWGENAHEFDPRRFITSREKERQQNKAFNPFGGGKHLCPGRFFADAEILGTLAALVLGFEVEKPEGGNLVVPPINNNMAEAVGKPLHADQQNLVARIKRRPGWENVKWGFVSDPEYGQQVI